MGEYEPNDSRNVTAAGNGAQQPSGDQRWNGDGQRGGQGGQMDQQQGQSGQQGDQMGYGSGREGSAQAEQQQGGAGQMGDGAGSGQQSQFQNNDRSQMGGGAGDGAGNTQVAQQIREHMEVIGADGVHVGTVDHVDGHRIKLTKKDSGSGSHEGHHHYISLGLVAGVEGDKVRLSANGDVAYGMEEEK